MKLERSIESWRIESVWPSPPKMTSWCATRPGQAHRVDRLVDVSAGLADQLGGALRRSRRRVLLLVAVQLDDLDLRHVRARSASTPPSSAPRRSRSSARRSSSPCCRRRRTCAFSSSRSNPVLPTTACTPASIASKTFAGAASGVVKSTITSAPSSTSFTEVSRAGSARPTSSMSSAPSTASQAVSPIRPAAPETTTLIGSAIARSYVASIARNHSASASRPWRCGSPPPRPPSSWPSPRIRVSLSFSPPVVLDLEANRRVIEDPGRHAQPAATGAAGLRGSDLVGSDRLGWAVGIATAIKGLNQQPAVGDADRDSAALEHALLLGTRCRAR